MNLIQQAEQLKSIPDQALAQMQQRPTDTPRYLVVAEMQRRANMRKAYEAAGQMPTQAQPPVAQQMAQQMQGPPQQQMQPGQAPPMQMAGGGLASLADYFDQMQGMMPVPQMSIDPGGMDFPGYSTMNDASHNRMRDLKTPVKDIEDESVYFDRMQESHGKSPLDAIAKKLEGEETEMRGKKPKLSQILMQLGLGMAASRNPTFAGALGEGGIGALQGYTHERDRTQILADRIAEKRLRAIEGSQRHKDRIQDYAVDARRGDIAARNMALQGNNNIEAGIRNQAARESHDYAMADRQQTALQAAAALAAQKDAADEAREMKKLGITTQTQLAIAKMNADAKKNKPGNGNGNVRDERKMSEQLMDNFNQMANSYEMQAIKLGEALQTPGLPKDQAERLQARVASLDAQALEMRNRALGLGMKMMGISPGAAAPPEPEKKKITVDDLTKVISGLPSGAQQQQAGTPARVSPQQTQQVATPPRQASSSSLGSYNPQPWGIFQGLADSWNRSGSAR